MFKNTIFTVFAVELLSCYSENNMVLLDFMMTCSSTWALGGVLDWGFVGENMLIKGDGSWGATGGHFAGKLVTQDQTTKPRQC